MTLYRSSEETKVSTTQREPYYIHTASGMEPVNPPPPPKSSTPAPAPHTTTTSDAASTLSAPLINPTHPPEICPPSASRWQKLKDENEARKSREVTRISLDEAARRSGRDQRGFKTGEESGWSEREKDAEMKRVWGCVVM